MRFFSKNITAYSLGERGVATVLVVGIIALFLLPFFVLAIDFAYVYNVRGQLHNAADAAALAGAFELDNPSDVEQLDAREAAWKFACNNEAAGSSVILVADGVDCENPPVPADLNIANDPAADIVVGNWDEALTPNFDHTRTPVNAVKVVARKTKAEMDGSFGVLFPNIISGWAAVDIGTTAIAYLPVAAEAPFALCEDTCGEGPAPGDTKILYLLPTNTEQDDDEVIAWTTMKSDQSSSSASELREFICDKNIVKTCGEKAATTHGILESVLKEFRCAFKDPTYSPEKKVITADGHVLSWELIVPILDHCPPAVQGSYDPYDVVQWGKITITEVYPKKGPKACNSCCSTCPDYWPSFGNESGENPWGDGIWGDYSSIYNGITNPHYEGGEEITGAVRISALECATCETAPWISIYPELVK